MQLLVAGEAVLEGDLGDDLHAPVVGVKFPERAVGVSPADATRAEDLVEPLDDGSRLVVCRSEKCRPLTRGFLR
jgi:hypothetical protein